MRQQENCQNHSLDPPDFEIKSITNNLETSETRCNVDVEYSFTDKILRYFEGHIWQFTTMKWME